MQYEGLPRTDTADTNKELVFELIQNYPEGIDDDAISELTGICPRQQVQHLCNQLAATARIQREAISKPGKRRKIHNFPIPERLDPLGGAEAAWRKRLAILAAVTGRPERDVLDEALQDLTVKVLREESAARD